MSELPLVVFTFLMQLAVGALVAAELTRFIYVRKTSNDQAEGALNKVVLVIGIIAIVALLASFAHLKTPLNAPFALTGFSVSWMSREIWFSVIFIVLLIIYIIVLLRNAKSAALKSGLGAVTAIVGLILVFCMASAYMMPAMPAWNSSTLPVTFYATALVMGPVFTGAALALFGGSVKKKAPGAASDVDFIVNGSVRLGAIIAAIAVAILVTSLSLHISELASQDIAAAITSAGMYASVYGLPFGVCLLFAVLGVFAFGAGAYFRAVRPEGADIWLYAAVVLVLISGAIERFLFYATVVNIGF